MSLKKSAVVGWLVLMFLNLVDLLLYLIALRHPMVNEVWVLGLFSPEEVVVIKLLMPVVVAGILSIKTSERVVRVLWYLCALYGLVMLWNLLQFLE